MLGRVSSSCFVAGIGFKDQLMLTREEIVDLYRRRAKNMILRSSFTIYWAFALIRTANRRSTLFT
jgi:hypothetical protein